MLISAPTGPRSVYRTLNLPQSGGSLDSHKFMRLFKRIICADISEFESYMPSHAVDLSASPSAGRRKPVACGLVPLKTRSWSRVRDHFGDHFVRCTFAGSLSAILDKTWEDRSWMQRHFLSLLE